MKEIKTNKRQKYIIIDWAGNHKFKEKVFFDIEAAQYFLLDKFPDDEDLQEFYIRPLK